MTNTHDHSAVDVKSRAELFQEVGDICSAVTAIVSPKELLETSLSKTIDLFGASRGSIFILNDKTKHLVLKSARGMELSEQKQMVKRLGQGIVGKVAQIKKPVVVDDIAQDSRFKDFKARSSYRTSSFICAPLLIKDKLIGVINVSDKQNGGRFTSDELQILDFLSSQIALNHRRIELYQKFKKAVRESKSLKNQLGKTNQETRVLKNKIVVQEKLATIGKLAGGIAHEFNNPLDGVLRYTNLCLEHVKDDEVVRGYLQEIKQGLNRMVNIVKSLLACSRSSNPSMLQIDPNTAVDQAVAAIQSDIFHKSISLDKQLGKDLPALTDFGLERAVSNLLRNAIDAVSQGGKVSVRTSLENGQILIEVADNGSGISSDALEKIFEPFYTTKDIDKGCGLGLTIVSEVVKSYDGEIKVESALKTGTTFVLVIPVKKSMTDNTKRKFSILVVDDEPLIRESLYEILRIDGFNVRMAASGEEAVETIKANKIDIVVADLKLPQMTGLDLLRTIKKLNAKIELIMITGYGSVETAVEAMKQGAYDYVTKPINDNEIKLIINRIIEKRQILEENENLREIIAQNLRSSLGGLIGSSEKMQKVYHVIESVASTNATILISGESGTGKGLVARAIHQMDQNRKDKPFVEISCGALSETLLESELFGHMKGAFTGAIKDKEGRFEFAKGGTIFLDEIDAFSPALQVKLLRVLQDGIFERVGDNVPRQANARIIVATNQSLMELVKQGKFREDLYYRINVIYIKMPPLRERREDLDHLIDHFIKKYSQHNNKKIKGISDDVRKLFLGHNWPGNIRELENAIEGAIIMAKTDLINKGDIPNVAKFTSVPAMENASGIYQGKPLKQGLEKPEQELILSILNECGWNRNKAAARLGINRTTLYNKMKKYKILDRPAGSG